MSVYGNCTKETIIQEGIVSKLKNLFKTKKKDNKKELDKKEVHPKIKELSEEELNKIKYIREKEYKEAIKIAKKALDITKKKYGNFKGFTISNYHNSNVFSILIFSIYYFKPI